MKRRQACLSRGRFQKSPLYAVKIELPDGGHASSWRLERLSLRRQIRAPLRLPSSKPVASIDYDGKIDARNPVEIAKVDSGSGRRALSRPG
jgi:hypothetical protein